MKYIPLFLILFIGSVYNDADAQTYKIESLDGTIQKIRISCNYDREILSISYLNNLLNIGDFTGIEGSVSVVNRRFLRIVYMVRGGSGIHLRRTLLLCVDTKILYQALNITSVFDEEFIDFRRKPDPANMVDKKSIYELKLDFTGGDIQTYKLNIIIADKKKSKHATSADYDHKSRVILNFDKNKNIFYSGVENISDYFTVFDVKTEKENKQFVMGEFPVIILGSFKYCYIGVYGTKKVTVII